MATSSTIAVVLPNGKVRAVYCHFDGYIRHNGNVLFEHYNSQELAELVTSVGSLSSLQHRFKPISASHKFNTPEKGTTIVYTRDRGERLVEKVYSSYEVFRASRNQLEPYVYLYRNGNWYVTDSYWEGPSGNRFVKLAKKLNKA